MDPSNADLEYAVSVIIPCYNAAEYVVGAVRSVVEQGTCAFEILVVDDQSTDNTWRIAEGLVKEVSNLRLYRQLRNSGPATARNTGLKHATGRLVCFLDSDDEYAPGFFSRVLPLFEADPRLGGVITGVELIDCHRPVHPAQLRAVIGSLPSNLMLRKEAADLLGGFPEDKAFRGRSAGEDIAFKTALSTWFKVIECSEKFLRYRVRAGSHFDYFLDRSKVVNGKLTLIEQSAEERSGALAAAQQRYFDQVRKRALQAGLRSMSACTVKPGEATTYTSEGNVVLNGAPELYRHAMDQINRGEIAEAAGSFSRLLALLPDHVEALTQLGIALARLRRLPEATAKLQRAIEIDPSYAKAHNNLGVAFGQQGRAEAALECWRTAVRYQPDYPEAHFNLGVGLAERGHVDEAMASYERALDSRIDYPEALNNLGLLLVHAGRPGRAAVLLQQALRLRQDYPEAQNNLSIALADLGRFEEALEVRDLHLRRFPVDAESHANRGAALLGAGRIDESLASYQQAIELRPDLAEAHWGRSIAWLTNGNCERGWPEYEWRWKRSHAKTRNLPMPRWSGEPLSGKRILIWCEQGLGDTIQFVRFASELKSQGATVCLECPGKLVHLLATCPGIDEVISEGASLPPDCDFQIPLMSLPATLETRLCTIPGRLPYLFADESLAQEWRNRIGERTKLKIGISWQGNPKHRFDRHRSFPVHWFRSLALLDGVTLYSLQKGPGSEHLKAVRFTVTDLGSHLDESGSAFQDTAAVMKALDLVITCDTALAHLGGALGVQVWVALSAFADWRWMHHISDTPWYPSMRLFRQVRLGQWGPVFERMRDAIQLGKW